MTLPTVAVAFIAHDQNGNPVAGARVQARLDQTEIYQGFVVPEVVEATADATGAVSLDLWPNELGVAGSAYQVRAWNPDTGKKFLDARAVVPNANCNLYQILVQEPYPPIDAAERALIAAQAAALSAQEDRVQTGLDRIQTGEDRVQTGLDRVQTGEDRVQTGEDRVQTGLDRAAAETALASITNVGEIAASLDAINTTADNLTAINTTVENLAAILAAPTEASNADSSATLSSEKALEASNSAQSASTSAITATTQASLATSAKTAAEAARDAAHLAAGVYATTAAGLAATTNGQYFNVPASSANDSLILYLNSSGTAVEQKRYPSTAAFDDLYRERLLARRAAFLARSVDRNRYAKRAAVLVLLGQSNNVPRGTAISGSVSRDVYMPVAGDSTTYWPFNSLNAEMCGNWTDLASAVVDTQGASENPGAGMALAMLGGTFSRVYMCSVSKGSTGIDALNSGGILRNCYAVINRLCAIARADGFEPVVVFDTHHGETDAYSSMSEDDYYSKAWAYYRKVQGFAAYAMGDVSYDAPIAFQMPIAYGTFGTAPNMRNVARAIVRLARDIPGGILLGGSYQFTPTDGVHHSNVAMRQKGEYAGMLLRDYFAKGDAAQCLQMVDAVWSGTTVTVTFNKEINYDTGLTFGTSLNTTNALGGFEVLDDGAFIKVMSIAVQGRKAVLTLQSAPVGTTQTVQIASQTMTGLPNTFQTIAGSQIRANYTGPVGIYDHTKTYHELAAPQTIEARP